MKKVLRKNTAILNVLRKAARCRKKVKIRYSKAYTREEVTRTIAPYSFNEPANLLWAWDFTKYRGWKSFNVGCILSAEILKQSFRPKVEVELS